MADAVCFSMTRHISFAATYIVPLVAPPRAPLDAPIIAALTLPVSARKTYRCDRILCADHARLLPPPVKPPFATALKSAMIKIKNPDRWIPRNWFFRAGGRRPCFVPQSSGATTGSSRVRVER